jgi:hypothetical protein
VTVPTDALEGEFQNPIFVSPEVPSKEPAKGENCQKGSPIPMVLIVGGIMTILCFVLTDITGTMHGSQTFVKNLFCDLGFSYKISCYLNLWFNLYTVWGYLLIAFGLSKLSRTQISGFLKD